MIIIWIIVSLIVFSLIVIIHELGHFGAARFFWVKVQEFWLWIPPKAKKLFTDKKWTQYTLNWLPLWWFVKLTWEVPNTFYVYNSDKKIYNNVDLEKDIQDWKKIFDAEWKEIWELQRQQILQAIQDNKASYNLANKPAWQQAIIILGWVFMNFLLAWIILSVLFFIWISPIWINTKIDTDLPLKLIPNYQQAIENWLLSHESWVILSPVKWSISEASWIQKWDIILSIQWEDEEKVVLNSAQEFIDIISQNPNTTYQIEWLRDNQAFSVSLTPEKDINSWEGKIWAYISENITHNKDFEYKYGFFESIKYWFSETYYQSLLTFQWIGSLVKKIVVPETPIERQEAIEQVSGPIGIVDFITNSLSAGIKFMFIIAAIISINLWVFNLLPIPALDGWRFIFIFVNGIIEKLFWKKAINALVENFIHVWFFILLIALSILIAYNDIIKIINS